MERTGARTELSRRLPSGFRNARIRETQALPLGWRHLTRVDLGQIRELVARTIKADPDLVQIETCLLLWSVLVTGRHPEDLLRLSMRIVAKGEALRTLPHGLIKRDRKWGWWLPAGIARDQRRTRPNMCDWSPSLYLPATRLLADLVERTVVMRRRLSAGRFQVSAVAQPLFVTGKPLIQSVLDLLAERHFIGPGRARRAANTMEALTRWLPAELNGAAGGDAVVASVISGKVPTAARTTSYYGAVPHEQAVRRYLGATAPADAGVHNNVPGELLTTHVGDRLTPTDEAVRGLIATLAKAVKDERDDAAAAHLALMRYTVALLAFAFAHRGSTGTMPAIGDIHSETRFCWIADKIVAGRSSQRLVWTAQLVIDQLGLYHAHLDHLQAAVSVPARSIIAEIRGAGGLPLFDMSEGVPIRLSVADALGGAFRVAGLPKNAGRHWLRAKLVGRCSTETLLAFYGHGPVDEGSWDRMSALDPAVYRADIARVLDPTLLAIGWRPLGAGSGPLAA